MGRAEGKKAREYFGGRGTKGDGSLFCLEFTLTLKNCMSGFAIRIRRTKFSLYIYQKN